MRQLLFAILWIGFAGYAFLFAPTGDPDTTVELLTRLVNGQFSELNPLLVAEFNLMGVLPLIYCCFLFVDGRERKLPAWIFAAGMMGVGAFALLPYLVFRGDRRSVETSPSRFIQFWDSRWVGLGLLVASIGLVAYGVLNGDWPGFVQLWQSEQFVHVMSLDFCLLCALLPVMVFDDVVRREQPVSSWVKSIVLIPLVGPLLYLCQRSQLTVPSEA